MYTYNYIQLHLYSYKMRGRLKDSNFQRSPCGLWPSSTLQLAEITSRHKANGYAWDCSLDDWKKGRRRLNRSQSPDINGIRPCFPARAKGMQLEQHLVVSSHHLVEVAFQGLKERHMECTARDPRLEGYLCKVTAACRMAAHLRRRRLEIFLGLHCAREVCRRSRRKTV